MTDRSDTCRARKHRADADLGGFLDAALEDFGLWK